MMKLMTRSVGIAKSSRRSVKLQHRAVPRRSGPGRDARGPGRFSSLFTRYQSAAFQSSLSQGFISTPPSVFDLVETRPR